MLATRPSCAKSAKSVTCVALCTFHSMGVPIVYRAAAVRPSTITSWMYSSYEAPRERLERMPSRIFFRSSCRPLTW